MSTQHSYVPDIIKHKDAIYEQNFAGESNVKKTKDWKNWLPIIEHQLWVPFCVTFAVQNAMETLANKKGVKLNLSDREGGVGSGTHKKGNSFNNVMEYGRKTGFVREDECPWNLKDIAKGWSGWEAIFDLPELDHAKRHKIDNHSWVTGGKQSMRNALDHTPLPMAVFVGETWEDKDVVKPPSRPGPGHAILNYHIDDYGCYLIYDSVGRPFKRLAPNYPVKYVKSLRVNPDNWRENRLNLRIIRNQLTGRIYFVNTDNKYIWIEDPDSFKKFMGDEAWNKKLWVDMPNEAFENADIVTMPTMSISKMSMWHFVREKYFKGR